MEKDLQIKVKYSIKTPLFLLLQCFLFVFIIVYSFINDFHISYEGFGKTRGMISMMNNYRWFYVLILLITLFIIFQFFYITLLVFNARNYDYMYISDNKLYLLKSVSNPDDYNVFELRDIESIYLEVKDENSVPSGKAIYINNKAFIYLSDFSFLKLKPLLDPFLIGTELDFKNKNL